MIPTLAETRKISLRSMAKKLGISPSYLCDIEKGRRTPSNNLYRKMLDEYGEIVNKYFYCRTLLVVTRRSGEEVKELYKEQL